MDCDKLNEVMTVSATALPDVVLLLERINTSPGTRYAAIGVANVFFSLHVNKTYRRQFASAGKGSNTPSLFTLRTIATIQLCIMSEFAEF